VSPESRNAFALRAAQAANAVHGIPVTFRSQEMRVCLAPIAIGLDLETGGLRQGGEFKCRFLASTLDSAPRRGEPVLYNGRTYFISQVSESHAPGEFLATLSPGGAA
jgi:hypothetical protein